MDISNQVYFLVLLGFAFALIGILSGIVIYLLLKSNQKGTTDNNLPAEVLIEKNDIHNCHNHEKEFSKGTCCICEKSYCESCLKEWDGLTFCVEHLETFSENKWVGITNIKTTPTNPEAAMYIYEFKKDQWKAREYPFIYS